MPHRRLARHTRSYGRRLGRRGIILATLGTLWIVTGVVTLDAPDPSAYYPLLSVWHVPRAIAWVTTGAVAVWAAHQPQGRDAYGWVGLYFMAAYRVIAYGHVLLLVVFDHTDATLRAALSLTSWLALLAVIRVCSGWREHHDDPLHTGEIPITDARR